MTGNNLIFYFSATGNSRHGAQCLQMANGGILVPMDTCLLEGQHKFSVDEACSVGFVFPVYFWGLPTIVAEFIAALQLDGTPQYPKTRKCRTNARALVRRQTHIRV